MKPCISASTFDHSLFASGRQHGFVDTLLNMYKFVCEQVPDGTLRLWLYQTFFVGLWTSTWICLYAAKHVISDGSLFYTMCNKDYSLSLSAKHVQIRACAGARRDITPVAVPD
jgi:hypothetical protein